MAKKKKIKGRCKDCKHFDANLDYPGLRVGKCGKGTDLWIISSIFDVREQDSCKKWQKLN